MTKPRSRLIIMRTHKLIARNAHAITRCVRVIRVHKSVHLNESERNYAYFSTREAISMS